MDQHEQQGPLNGVTPHLTISDNRAAEAIDFYKAAFDAEELLRMPGQDGKRLIHVHLKINGGSLMLNDDFPEYRGHPAGAPASVTLHLQVDDADRWFERAVGAGATAVMGPSDMFWGDRYGQARDPFGHLWSIGASKTSGAAA
jgi:PhnB protein